MFCTYKYSHSGGIVLLLITLKMNLPHCCQMLELVCDILSITSQLLNPYHKNVRFFLDFSSKLLCLPFAFFVAGCSILHVVLSCNFFIDHIL